jgi:hypothetical protein
LAQRSNFLFFSARRTLSFLLYRCATSSWLQKHTDHLTPAAPISIFPPSFHGAAQPEKFLLLIHGGRPGNLRSILFASYSRPGNQSTCTHRDLACSVPLFYTASISPRSSREMVRFGSKIGGIRPVLTVDLAISPSILVQDRAGDFVLDFGPVRCLLHLIGETKNSMLFAAKKQSILASRVA